jgi:hypothetical protein
MRLAPFMDLNPAAIGSVLSRRQRTTDSDILGSASLDANTKARLLHLAGPGTNLHRRHGMYVQIINEAIPFLPQVPVWHSVGALNKLVHLDITVLDVVDVVVSKLKRFHARDSADIAAMIELGLVPHERLIERFRMAVDWFAYDARADELPKYCANLNRVERDFLAVEETEIVLPSWIR